MQERSTRLYYISFTFTLIMNHCQHLRTAYVPPAVVFMHEPLHEHKHRQKFHIAHVNQGGVDLTVNREHSDIRLLRASALARIWISREYRLEGG